LLVFSVNIFYSQALTSHDIPLIIVSIIGSAISIYFYFRLIVTLFKGESDEVIQLSMNTKIVLILSIVFTLLLGLFPDSILGGW
jgi:NADH-quinone oxidoreductase subunit N